MSERKEVAIYVRVSTLEQAENNWSIEGQLNECREHCDRKRYRVVRIYKDAGESAATLDRPGLGTMLEHVGAGFFEKLVLWKYDRLSRDNIDFPALLHFFNKNGVEVESITEPTPNDGSPYNEFIVGILGLVSTMERRVFVMRSKMGMRTRLKKGLHRGSTPPYGYDYDPSTGHLEVNPVESKVVREMFDMYLELGTLCALRKHLNDNGHKPRSAGRWWLSTIQNVLRNRVYLGEYRYKDIITKHEEVRLIDDEKFEKVQKRLDERSKLGVTNRYHDKRVERFKDKLSFDSASANPVVQTYLQKKASMPPCPRCGDRMNVIKYGKHRSPTVGDLQQYYCKPCNYEFTPSTAFRRRGHQTYHKCEIHSRNWFAPSNHSRCVSRNPRTDSCQLFDLRHQKSKVGDVPSPDMQMATTARALLYLQRNIFTSWTSVNTDHIGPRHLSSVNEKTVPADAYSVMQLPPHIAHTQKRPYSHDQ